MATPFFIVGLPRSRTAWLAAFFSAWDVECMHDGLRYSETFPGLLSDLRNSDAAYAGDSDSGLLFHWKELEQSGARVLFVHRHVAEVRASLKRSLGINLTEPVIDAYKQAVEGLRTSVMHVSFSSLSDERVLRRAWEWLAPGINWDPARYRLFRQLNIQAHMPVYMQEVTGCRGAH